MSWGLMGEGAAWVPLRVEDTKRAISPWRLSQLPGPGTQSWFSTIRDIMQSPKSGSLNSTVQGDQLARCLHTRKKPRPEAKEGAQVRVG